MGHGAQVARRDFRIGMPTMPWNNRRRVIDPPSKPITTPPAPLEYDRTPNHVTRGQFRVLLFMVFINTVAIVGYVCVPGGSQWARQTWADYQNKRAAKAKEQRVRDAANKRIADFQKALPLLAAMKLPADTPVYTEDGVEAASLLASDPAYETVPFDRRGMQVSVWQAAVGRGEGRRPSHSSRSSAMIRRCGIRSRSFSTRARIRRAKIGWHCAKWRRRNWCASRHRTRRRYSQRAC
jgi:hypothetical protein